MIEAIVANSGREDTMLVSEGMTDMVLTIGPGHTLREAAQAMWERRVGAAVVVDPDAPGPAVLTERDILRVVAQGRNPSEERVGDHLTANVTVARLDWSLEQAAQAMVRGGFRHLLVVNGSDLVGILSMRDIVRVWCGEGAACDVPAA